MSTIPRPLTWLWCLFLPWSVLSGTASASIGAQLTTPEKTQLQREARLVVDLVQNYHYSGQTFQGVQNAEILTRFLADLDPQGDIFAPADRAFVHQRFDHTLKTVYLFRGDLAPAFEIFDTFSGLATRRLQWIDQRLGQDFDFSTDETYTETNEAGPAETDGDLDRHWERRLKDEMLTELVAGRTLDAARAHLRQSYAEAAANLALYDSFSVREHFLNAAPGCFDPHSGYSSADSTKEFAGLIEGSSTGVGLGLKRVRGRCVVAALLPGGPADLHSALAPGDTVEALANGDGPWTDVSGLRWREVLALLRGTRGSTLRVAYHPHGGPDRREVTLTRERLVLTTNRARGAVSVVPTEAGGSHRVGWIVLPSFYGTPGRSAVHASADLRELIATLTAERIDALVIDLRTNPGGEMNEVAAAIELFVPRGTVLLLRKPDGTIQPLPAKPGTPVWTGPLVVLTAPTSASAAEIFAAAMRQHRRALIVGGAATYGKGSSQNFIDLAKAAGLQGRESKDWGSLRLTTARFYSGDGSAIQGTGVASHVVLPNMIASRFKRESDLPHALPAESVTPPPQDAAPEPPALAPPLLSDLVNRGERNVANLPEWTLVTREATAREQTEAAARSLRREKRQQAWDAMLVEQAAIQQTRRTLAASAAYPTKPVELAAVGAALDAHRAKLLADAKTTNPPAHPVYRDGAVLMATDQAHIEAIHLTQFRFGHFLGDAAELSRVVAKEVGKPVDEIRLRAALQELMLLEEPTDSAVAEVVTKALPAGVEPAATARALAALLGRMAELEPGFAAERPPLDVPLREALRLGAAWAETVAVKAP